MMTDPFIDRVAELSGQTNKTLEQVAEDLEASGLPTQARTLRVMAKMHMSLAHDCLTTTQPIEIFSHDLSVRIRRSIEEIKEISADLLTRGKGGHSELSEAAELLQRAVDQQGK